MTSLIIKKQRAGPAVLSDSLSVLLLVGPPDLNFEMFCFIFVKISSCNDGFLGTI